MKSMKRVVVTGMGAITPIGNSVEEFWNGRNSAGRTVKKVWFEPTLFLSCRHARNNLEKERLWESIY